MPHALCQFIAVAVRTGLRCCRAATGYYHTVIYLPSVPGNHKQPVTSFFLPKVFYKLFRHYPDVSGIQLMPQNIQYCGSLSRQGIQAAVSVFHQHTGFFKKSYSFLFVKFFYYFPCTFIILPMEILRLHISIGKITFTVTGCQYLFSYSVITLI